MDATVPKRGALGARGGCVVPPVPDTRVVPVHTHPKLNGGGFEVVCERGSGIELDARVLCFGPQGHFEVAVGQLDVVRLGPTQRRGCATYILGKVVRGPFVVGVQHDAEQGRLAGIGLLAQIARRGLGRHLVPRDFECVVGDKFKAAAVRVAAHGAEVGGDLQASGAAREGGRSR